MMNEGRDIVRKCLTFLLEMLTMTKMGIVLVKKHNPFSFFPLKKPNVAGCIPPPERSMNSELVGFDLFHLNRLLEKKETI